MRMVGNISNPHLIQSAYVHFSDEVGIDREAMVAVRGGNPPTLDVAAGQDGFHHSATLQQPVV
jgi:hypothetical protein